MRRSALAAVLTVTALLCAGQSPALAADPANAGARQQQTDPFTELGGGSPSCRQDVGTAGRRNCAATGSIANQHPVGNYGLDSHVSVGITHLGDAVLAALQALAGASWMALVYLVKGVLLLLEWAFSVDLLGTAMAGVRHTLIALHDNVIGQPWFLAALSVTALWGIWRGLVQRQATQTVTGLVATIALMVCGLVILARPNETVGHASRLANEASLGLLSAATAQPLDHPSRSLAEASRGVFDSLVRDPWCALEFGSVDYCDQPAIGGAQWCALGFGSGTDCRQQAGRDPTPTVADAWLAFGGGSKERDFAYHLIKGDLPFHASDKLKVPPDPARVRMQEAGGTFSRFAILGLVAIGLLGACALLAYLGIRLLLASVLALLLLLFTPAVLLAPAFGERGRSTFVAWGKRLAGALAAKLIYALFLAVVLAAAAILRRLDIGWFGTWLLQIAFWWGVLIKRHELIGFASAGQHPARQGAFGFATALAQGYYATQLARNVAATSRRVGRTPRRAVAAVNSRRKTISESRATAAGERAAEAFDAQGRRVLEGEYERATAAASERRQAERELRVVDRRLTAFDETHAGARASGMPVPIPTKEQGALVRRRRELLERLASPELRGADQVLLHGERNRAQTGGAVTARDLAAYRHQRTSDLAADLPIEHERNLRAAGVDPAAFRAADDTGRTALLEQVRTHLARERELLAAIPEPAHDHAAGQPALRVDHQAFRQRVAEARAQARRDRRLGRIGRIRSRQ